MLGQVPRGQHDGFFEQGQGRCGGFPVGVIRQAQLAEVAQRAGVAI